MEIQFSVKKMSLIYVAEILISMIFGIQLLVDVSLLTFKRLSIYK